MKKRLTELASSFLLLLVAGCGEDESPWDSVAPEYGTPVDSAFDCAEYNLEGVVIESTKGQPVEGIELSFQHGVTHSDAEGAWHLGVETEPCGAECVLTAADIDGAEHGGEHRPVTVALAPEVKERSGTACAHGAFKQHDIEVSMTLVAE